MSLKPFSDRILHPCLPLLALFLGSLNTKAGPIVNVVPALNRTLASTPETTVDPSDAPVTLQVKEADVEDVFRLIGEASGLNVILGPEVKGKISLSLVNVPWSEALNVVLQTLQLGSDRHQNILRIMSLEKLSQQKEAQLKLNQLTQTATPQITRVFPIHHADPKELQALLTPFTSQATGGLDSKESKEASGILQHDSRTNHLILQDTPEHIERLAKIIETLDTPAPQVMIEAKVVEATESFSKTLSGSLGAGSPSQWTSFAGGNPIDQLVGSSGVFSSGTAIANATGTSGALSGSLGLSPQLQFFKGSFRLNALLSWGETESVAKVISSPKLVVLNREKATLVQGTPILVPGTTTIAGVGADVPNQSVQHANISLMVKPTVSPKGTVLLDLSVSKDIPVALNSTQYGVGSRNLNTLVVVENGSTLAIGGIYSLEKTKVGTGVPFLRKIPLIGGLFGSEQDSTRRLELLIFITPRILKPQEAPLG